MAVRADALEAVREPVDGSCPACGASSLARYEVLGDGGWLRVTKCQSCLHSVDRTRLNALELVGRGRYR